MLKVITGHGTYYLVDLENGRAARYKGEGRNDMLGDEEWFSFSSVRAYPQEGSEFEPIAVGKQMFFNLTGPRHYDWRTSTTVTSIEEVS